MIQKIFALLFICLIISINAYNTYEGYSVVKINFKNELLMKNFINTFSDNKIDIWTFEVNKNN
jgi:hypothetical protein